MKRMTIVSLAGCLGLLAAASTCFAQQYAVTDLGTLGGIYSVAYHLNNRGDAVGYSQITGSAVYDAFLYSNGIMTDLGTLGGSGSQALGINNTGQVVGFSYITGNNPFNGAGIGHAFIYSGGVMTDLGTLGGTLTSSAYAINDAGQVVGSAETTGNTAVHAFLYSGGVMTDLGALDLGSGSYNDSVATAINTGGQAAGYSFNGFLTHAFLYSGGIMTDLGTLGGQTDRPRHSRRYVQRGLRHQRSWGGGGGAYTAGNSAFHAFLYSGGVMKDINPAGWSDTDARGINDSGQIVGFGINPQGQEHGFILTPIIPYKASVQPPINADGSSIFNASRGVVPVKFTLIQNGTQTCALPPATISATRTAGGTVGAIDEASYLSPADNGSNFRIDANACQYVYNLEASELGVGIYRVDITINGSVVGSGSFALK